MSCESGAGEQRVVDHVCPIVECLIRFLIKILANVTDPNDARFEVPQVMFCVGNFLKFLDEVLRDLTSLLIEKVEAFEKN